MRQAYYEWEDAMRVVDIKIDLCQLYRILSARKLIKSLEAIDDDETANDEQTAEAFRRAMELGFGADLDWVVPLAKAVSSDLVKASHYIDRDL